MRVLVTGVSPNHVGANRGKSFWDTELVETALQHAGHKVTRRAVTVGEDLQSHFDVAVIGQQKLNSMMAFYYRYGALWAGAQLPHIVLYEDFAKGVKEYRTGLKPRYIWDYPTLKMSTPRLEALREGARPYRDTLDAVVERWRTPETRGLMIAYGWGKHDQLRPFLPGKTTFLDLTAFYDGGWGTYTEPQRLVPPERQWTFATLVHSNKWRYDPRVKTTWPVTNLGFPDWSRGVKLSRGGFRGKKLARHELLRVYRDSSGILTWPYKGEVVGAGVWRDRVHDGVLGRRVVWTDSAEMAGFGPAYQHSVAEIEALTTTELYKLADAQAAAVKAHQLPRDNAAMLLTKLLTEATL